MKTMSKPKFEGIPLIEIPQVIPYADFVRGDFGKAVEEEFNARVRENYKDNKSLKGVLVYDEKDKILKGSNPFANVVVNNLDIVKEQGLYVATQSDLERILRLKRNDFNLEGTYEDSGLALRSVDNPNVYLARDLVQQIKERQALEFPAMIPLKGLDLELDENSDNQYELRFMLKEDAEVIYAPILNNFGNFYPEDIDEKIGLPRKTGEKGERHLYRINSGLSGVCLSRYRSVNAGWSYLANSYRGGRVVLVRGEATSQKFSPIENYASQLQEEKSKKIRVIESRYQKALKILEGKE